jgi:hypothetical protein
MKIPYALIVFVIAACGTATRFEQTKETWKRAAFGLAFILSITLLVITGT